MANKDRNSLSIEFLKIIRVELFGLLLASKLSVCFLDICVDDFIPCLLSLAFESAWLEFWAFYRLPREVSGRSFWVIALREFDSWFAFSSFHTLRLGSCLLWGLDTVESPSSLFWKLEQIFFLRVKQVDTTSKLSSSSSCCFYFRCAVEMFLRVTITGLPLIF